MKKTVLLKNAEAIVSCDPADRVYRGCDILIRNGFIAEIGAGLSAEGAETIDASRKFYLSWTDQYASSFFPDVRPQYAGDRLSEYDGRRMA